MQKKFKRKKKLINKSLQLKMVGVFTAIGCVCALFQIVLVNQSLLSIAKEASDGAGSTVLAEARGMMLRNVAWTIGAMVPLMGCIGIVLTHRIAGPAYRMTQYCLGIANGDEVKPCTIRKDDELKELCAALNAAISHLAPATDGNEGFTEKWQLDDAPMLVQVSSSQESVEEPEPAAS